METGYIILSLCIAILPVLWLNSYFLQSVGSQLVGAVVYRNQLGMPCLNGWKLASPTDAGI